MMVIVINGKLYNLHYIQSIAKCYKDNENGKELPKQAALTFHYHKNFEFIRFKTMEERDETFEKIVKIMSNN